LRDEEVRDALDVHRVRSEPAGELSHAAARFVGDETQDRSLRRGQPDVGEGCLPAPASRAVGETEEEPNAADPARVTARLR
jgi:hypothetical protein